MWSGFRSHKCEIRRVILPTASKFLPRRVLIQALVYFFHRDGKKEAVVDCSKRYVALLDELVKEFGSNSQHLHY